MGSQEDGRLGIFPASREGGIPRAWAGRAAGTERARRAWSATPLISADWVNLIKKLVESLPVGKALPAASEDPKLGQGRGAGYSAGRKPTSRNSSASFAGSERWR